LNNVKKKFSYETLPLKHS